MGNILPEYFHKFQYTLRGPLGTKEISAPKNWDEDDKIFKRSTKSHGVFANLSSNLVFYQGDDNNDGGYDWLKQTYDIYGINASVLLIKEESVSDISQDPENIVWEEAYRGNLDYSTYSRIKNTITLAFDESGLYEKIKARRGEKLELGRTTTMEGSEIAALETETVELDGREINQINKFRAIQNPVVIQGDLKFYEARAVNMELIAETSGNVQTIYTVDVDENTTTYGQGTTGNMFYANAPAETELKIDFDLSIAINTFQNITWVRFDLVKYGGGTNYNFISYDNLITFNNVNSPLILLDHIDYREITLNAGESLALAVHFKYGNTFTMNTIKADVKLQELQFFESSTAKMLLPFETLDRIVHIMTDEENRLISDHLGRTDIGYDADGPASLTGLTNGFWVRQFDDREFTTSYNDYFTSFTALWQLGYGIERRGFSEHVRAEPWNYFYQDVITIRLDAQPKDILRTIAKEYFYSGLEIGFNKPSGDRLYDESLGLDEYNIKNTWTTFISRVENVFKQISKYRADSYGKEFARRKSQKDFPETDTRYDKEIFMMDLKRNDEGGQNFMEKKWADDFVTPTPFNKTTTGVYSPETATNMRFSPVNMILRWGFWIRGGLEKYLNQFVRYGSSEGNSSLKTQLLTSSIEYEESGTILNSDLTKGIIDPFFIDFQHPVDGEMLRLINGETLLADNTTLKNYYGLIEFINEDGKYEYGWLMEVKPNGEGSWKLLKSTRPIVTVSTLTDDTVEEPSKPQEGDGFDYEFNEPIDG